jgi:hypothetical protein
MQHNFFTFYTLVFLSFSHSLFFIFQENKRPVIVERAIVTKIKNKINWMEKESDDFCCLLAHIGALTRIHSIFRVVLFFFLSIHTNRSISYTLTRRLRCWLARSGEACIERERGLANNSSALEESILPSLSHTRCSCYCCCRRRTQSKRRCALSRSRSSEGALLAECA